jgi:predicted AAA+ superfamily ATPase
MNLVLRSLARNVATTASVPTIVADVRGEGNMISEPTVYNYLDRLRKLFIIDEQDAWHPLVRSKTRIRTSPKRHFADPSLAAAALGARPEILRKDARTAGFLFKSLCYRDLSAYAAASKGRVFHYRDNSDLEVDSVVQFNDGRWGAVEVKLGWHECDKAAANLLHMKKKTVAAGAEEPSFLMILHAAGGGARTRSDGVVEVPIDCLGP